MFYMQARHDGLSWPASRAFGTLTPVGPVKSSKEFSFVCPEDGVVGVMTDRRVFVQLEKEGEHALEGGDGIMLTAVVEAGQTWTVRILDLPPVSWTPEEMEKERQDKKISLWSGHISDLPSSLGEAIAFLQEQMDKIPKDAQQNACLDIDGTEFEILYWAPETDEELMDRAKVEAYRERANEEAERWQLKRLQEKYGEGKP